MIGDFMVRWVIIMNGADLCYIVKRMKKVRKIEINYKILRSLPQYIKIQNNDL
jgi:hypothetical protein